MHAFGRWLSLLRPLCDAIAELLWLTRQNGRPREEHAAAGVFNVTFDRDTPYQLLRISVPPGIALYPEISGSHYRCSMRFLRMARHRSALHAERVDVPFTLICCT
jgi:cell division protein ZapD